MERLIVTLVIFVLMYVLYLMTVIGNKKKMENFEKSGQAAFIIKRYCLDASKLDKKLFANLLAFTNSFILSITFFITDFLEDNILKWLTGFLILVPLIILGYHLIGIYFKKKEVKKHV